MWYIGQHVLFCWGDAHVLKPQGGLLLQSSRRPLWTKFLDYFTLWSHKMQRSCQALCSFRTIGTSDYIRPFTSLATPHNSVPAAGPHFPAVALAAEAWRRVIQFLLTVGWVWPCLSISKRTNSDADDFCKLCCSFHGWVKLRQDLLQSLKLPSLVSTPGLQGTQHAC